jgi:hypothetical protein
MPAKYWSTQRSSRAIEIARHHQHSIVGPVLGRMEGADIIVDAR